MDSPDTVTTHRAEPRFERRTVDGQELRIAVWTGLSSDKPPLLLFNGIGSRIELLAPFVEHLDPEREIIALDIPGTGESPATPFPYRLWMMARKTRVAVAGWCWRPRPRAGCWFPVI